MIRLPSQKLKENQELQKFLKKKYHIVIISLSEHTFQNEVRG